MKLCETLLEGPPVLAKKRYFDVHTDGWAEEQVHFQERAQNSHNFSELPCLCEFVFFEYLDCVSLDILGTECQQRNEFVKDQHFRVRSFEFQVMVQLDCKAFGEGFMTNTPLVTLTKTPSESSNFVQQKPMCKSYLNVSNII